MRSLITSQDVKIYCSLSAFNAPLCPLTDSEHSCEISLRVPHRYHQADQRPSRNPRSSFWHLEEPRKRQWQLSAVTAEHLDTGELQMCFFRINLSNFRARRQLCDAFVTSGQDVVRSSRTITGRLLAVPQATAPLSVRRLIVHFRALWKYQNNTEINNAGITDSSLERLSLQTTRHGAECCFNLEVGLALTLQLACGWCVTF